MGLTLKETGTTFELCPAGTHQARCYTVADIGTQAINFNGESKLLHKVIIIWEIAEKMKDGQPFAVSNIYTASLHEKSSLRKDLEAWRGRSFTPEELQGFKMDKVLNTSCFLNIIHEKDKQGRDRARISSIMALPKGVPAMVPINPNVYFDFGEFDSDALAKLPEWIQTMLKKSPEYQAACNQFVMPPEFDEMPPITDDIPF